MGLFFNKRVKVGKRSSLNFSKRGVSASYRVGPFSFSTRGRKSLRLGKGFFWRF